MTTPEDRDGEALKTWQADRRRRLAENLIATRPPEFDRPGKLDPRFAQWADDLAGGQPRNLAVTGPTGTGKTWSVWHAAERAVRAGYEGRVIITTAAWFRRIIAPVTADPVQFGRMAASGLLAIDDLGSVRLSEWDMDHLGELVDERWSAQLPTVVTSNVTALRDLLGPRISSRLVHNAAVVELDGPDRRRQA